MKIVFASAAGGWQHKALDDQNASNRLESYYYAVEKQFDRMFEEIEKRNANNPGRRR